MDVKLLSTLLQLLLIVKSPDCIILINYPEINLHKGLIGFPETLQKEREHNETVTDNSRRQISCVGQPDRILNMLAAFKQSHVTPERRLYEPL